MAERASAPEPERETPAPVTPSQPAGRSLPAAIATALVLVGLLIGAYAAGRTWFFVLVSVLLLIALFEAFDGLHQAGHRVSTWWGLACGLAMLIVAFRERPALLGAVLAGTMAGAFVLAMRPGRGPSPTTDVAWTLLMVAWVGGGAAGAVTIMMIEPDGKALLVWFVLTTALSDIGGFFAGTAFGRHKMAPSLSPAKSWEGAAGGFVLALAGGLLAAAAVGSLDPIDGLALGAMCGLLAPVGDLVESMFKRELGIKDSGRLLPGHGGILDRLDAVVFVAPAAAVLLEVVT